MNILRIIDRLKSEEGFSLVAYRDATHPNPVLMVRAYHSRRK